MLTYAAFWTRTPSSGDVAGDKLILPVLHLVSHFTERNCIAVPDVDDQTLFRAKQGATDAVAARWPPVEGFTDAE